MKKPCRIFLRLSFICLMGICAFGSGQNDAGTLGDQIKGIQEKLKAAQQQGAEDAAGFKKLESKLGDIKFAAEAYKKQNDRWNQDADKLNIEITTTTYVLRSV